MKVHYAVSLWNYFHYTGRSVPPLQRTNVPSLDRIVALLREHGYGLELWASSEEDYDLVGGIAWKRLKHLLQGMRVSLHTSGANTFDLHRQQVDMAADVGAEVIVLHAHDLISKESLDLDVQLTCRIVAYAAEHGIRLALENAGTGRLPFLVNATEKVKGLGICLDIGHIYFTPDPMSRFLDALEDRIIHLHVQDILPGTEPALALYGRDHYTPGTGGIPKPDWELLARALAAIDFQGMAVFEIRPRSPLQTAYLGKTFMKALLDNTQRAARPSNA